MGIEVKMDITKIFHDVATVPGGLKNISIFLGECVGSVILLLIVLKFLSFNMFYL